MYDVLLHRLDQILGLTTDDEKKAFLADLIPTMRALKASYESSAVATDYSGVFTQVCYLLRYFPPYTQLLPVVLQKANRYDGLLTGTRKIVFFGAGPAPELYGLLEWLGTKFAAKTSFDVYLYDKASAAWKFERDICLNTLIPSVWPHGIAAVNTRDLDVGAAWTVSPEFQEAIQGASLVVFQNCLNEVTNFPQLQANLAWVLERMPPSSLFVMVDRAGYNSASEFMTWVEEQAASHGFDVLKKHNPNWADSHDVKPLLQSIPQYVLDSGLMVVRTVFAPIAPHENGLVLQNGITYHAVVLRKK